MTTRVNDREGEMTLMEDERCLEADAVERLPGMHPGNIIVCTSGILWVTQEGDPKDYVVQEGSAFVANCQGLVVVQALTKATYRFSSNYTVYDQMRLDLKGKPRPLDNERAFESLRFERQYRRLPDDLLANFADDCNRPAEGK